MAERQEASGAVAPSVTETPGAVVQEKHWLDGVGLDAEKRAELRYILNFSWPIVLNFLMGFSLALGSQIVVGRLGPLAFGAASLASMWANALGYAIAMGSAAAVDILSSQSVGARNYARVGIISQRGVCIMSLLAIPIAATWIWGSEPALLALGIEAQVVSVTKNYLRVLVFGLWPTLIYEVFKRHLQALGVTTPPMLMMACGALFNLVLGAILVHGGMGIVGAPIATVITQWLMLAQMFFYFRNHRSVNAKLNAAAAFLSRAARPITRARAGRKTANEEASLEANSAKTVDLRPLGPVEVAPLPAEVGVEGEGQQQQQRAALSSESANSSLAEENIHVSIKATEKGQQLGDDPSSLAAPTPTSPSVLVNDDGVLITDHDDLIDASLSGGFKWSHALSGWKEYLSLGIPSAALLFTEWSAYECAALVAGLVSVNTLAAHTIIASTASLVFMPALGLSIASSIRSGQRMGENNAPKAKLAYNMGLLCVIVWGIINGVFILAVQSAWPYLYTDDDEVAALVSHSLWMLALYSLADFAQCASGSALRAVGRPGVGAATNVFSWLVVGVPGAFLLGYKLEMGLRGIWFAFIMAVVVAFILMSIALSCINWPKEAQKAHDRAKAGQGAPAGGH